MSYTFYTINTVVDIGDGNSGILNSDKFTSTMNLMRLAECIMQHSYPLMVSVTKNEVDLRDNTISNYYNLPQYWGKCTVSTFKFSLELDIDLNIDNIPLVIPTVLDNDRIVKFKTSNINGTINTSILKTTFK